VKPTIQRRQEAVDMAEDLSVTTGPGRIIAFSRDRRQLSVIEERSTSTFTLFAESDAIFCLGEQLFFCPDASSVATISIRGEAAQPFCQAFSRVVRIHADGIFKIVVVATMDGVVRIFDLLTGDLVRAVDVGGEAKLLAVAPKWGLVVAAVGNDVVVMNVNGVLLRRTEVAEVFVPWTACASHRDFDWIVFATEAGKVGAFEALHPERTVAIHDIKEAVAAVVFDAQAEAITVISKRGSAAIVPHQFTEAAGHL
jgi:hypothetical protein